MQDLTSAQKARVAIQSFKTLANALALRGFFRPSGRMGQALAECLKTLSPEIYGSMNDFRVVELKGLEYVIERLPRGIEECTRIILTEEEQSGNSNFEKIIPLKRRRTCYRISDTEICFVITRGMSEIYDILTHLTFLNIEARKIHRRMTEESGKTTNEWRNIEKIAQRKEALAPQEADQALWDLSLVVGRSFHETRQAYDNFERARNAHQGNNGLFRLIYHLGSRVAEEAKSLDHYLRVHMTPSLMNIIAHQRYGAKWAEDIKNKLKELGLEKRPLHIISANLHSVVNLLYGHAAVTVCRIPADGGGDSLYDFIRCLRDHSGVILSYAREHGLTELPDRSGTHIDCQIIDTARLGAVALHPGAGLSLPESPDIPPVLLVMDYAFGAQAFEVMDRLLEPYGDNHDTPMNAASISIMGKAGILPGKKGDILLATAHVIEGSSDNYIIENDLSREDFDPDMEVYIGPMITVLGTSLQNRDMLKAFQRSWNTVGLEMEGAHYQRAISAAIIKGHIPKQVRVRYAYYASDNPLESGQTLAAGEMGEEGVRPTYMVTKVILKKIFSDPGAP